MVPAALLNCQQGKWLGCDVLYSLFCGTDHARPIDDDMLFACRTENSAEPVYEVPSEKYAIEEFIRILLDPKIDQNKVCKQQPLDIISSSTYVVDLDCLQHPDDVKKDNFGVWTHSGSHTRQFFSRINQGRVEIG